ncbi:rCG32073, isoform CRA_a [Rattus norvegicus]|uniref:RCG32073, isoform CRA_a n=1 Tax=Rattus norvegicus TaxID=10116 RepID=A6JWY8_RAT|nr:rCG32073, isoform CRA_a [Rattus norvegicus]EDL96621.1 rCG32073, isoform CRA_a [Rattus norvegicus]
MMLGKFLAYRLCWGSAYGGPLLLLSALVIITISITFVIIVVVIVIIIIFTRHGQVRQR